MNLEYIWVGFKIGFVASIPLGPIGVLCIQRTLSKGKLSGFISGIGAATSDAIYAIIAFFSLSYVVNFIEKQLLLLQIFGVVFLVFLGLKIFYTNPAKQLRRQNKKTNSYIQDFVSTFFLTITNPLYVFLFLGFFAGFRVVTPKSNIIDPLILIAGVLIGATTWWFVLTSIVNLFRSKINLRRLWWINKIAGASIVILVIAAFIIWTIREYTM
ncbi:MAG: LysE family transporter [Marinilabiliaceae bacterium]|nr:LysE family transporter [Marinilabiliaceae bacterium]